MARRSRKEEMRRKKTMSIFLLVILTVSTIGFGIVSFGHLGGGDNDRDQQDLPDRVRNGDFTPAEETQLVNSGATIMKYYYPDGCVDCESNINRITQLTENHEDLFVAFISQQDQRLYAESRSGNETVQEVNEDSIMNTYCSVTPYRWDDCLVREI